MAPTKRKRLVPPKARGKAALDDQPGGRVFGYCRVSTVAQANEGESLDVQRRQIEGYAMQHGRTLEKVFIERGVSVSKPLPEREQGGTLIRDLRPGDIVITPKLDRMFHSALDALDVLQALKAGGVSLHMIDLGGDVAGNGISKLVFTILSAVAEAERDRTRERIAEVKADQRKRGRFLGGIAPFGFAKVKDASPRGYALVAVPEQQATIRKMQKLRAQGMALRPIAEAMQAEGVKISHVGVGNALEAAAATVTRRRA